MTMDKFLLVRPGLLNELKILVIPFSQLVFNGKFVLICTWSQNKSLVFEFIEMAITHEFDFEIASIVLLLIFVHSLVNECFSLERLQDSLEIIVLLEYVFHFLVQIKGQSVAPLFHEAVNNSAYLVAKHCCLDVLTEHGCACMVLLRGAGREVLQCVSHLHRVSVHGGRGRFFHAWC